jgi:hypothetical protein
MAKRREGDGVDPAWNYQGDADDPVEIGHGKPGDISRHLGCHKHLVEVQVIEDGG